MYDYRLHVSCVDFYLFILDRNRGWRFNSPGSRSFFFSTRFAVDNDDMMNDWAHISHVHKSIPMIIVVTVSRLNWADMPMTRGD